MKFRIGTITVLMVVVLIAVKTYYRPHLGRIWEHVPAAVRAAAADQDGPIETPPLPDIGPGREIEPGVMFHEARLPGGDKPGFAGKLWLYLPSGDHAVESLPCVLITAGGSSLLKGIHLSEHARAEQLPYVRAGFAVLAYELDGALPEGRNASEAEMKEAMARFLAARAGLVNATSRSSSCSRRCRRSTTGGSTRQDTARQRRRQCSSPSASRRSGAVPLTRRRSTS